MASETANNKMTRMADYWTAQAATSMALNTFPLPPQKWQRVEHILEVQTALWGKRYVEYRDNLKKAVAMELVPERPIHVDFDLKDSCNLACINCSENYRPWSRKELDLDRLFADPLFEKGKLCSATIGNGTEPFLVPDKVFRVVKFLRECDVMDIWFHSNATLFTPEIIDQLIDHQVTWMGISLDAFSRDTYSKVRGKKEFDVAYANVNALLARKKERNSPFPLVRVTAVAMPENLHELADFQTYWKNQGVDMVEFQTFGAVTPVGQQINPHVASHPSFIHVEGNKCSQMFWRMSVGASGAVSPCCMSYGFTPDLTLGNVFAGEGTLLDMWKSHRMELLRQQHASAAGPVDFKACTQCVDQFWVLKDWATIAPIGS